MSAPADEPGWPPMLRPGALRFGRASRHYDKTIAFYADLVGLPVVDEFTASFGEDGTIFGLPGTAVQLEIIRAHEPTAVGAFDQLVLYLDSAAAVEAATAPLRGAGLSPHPDPHPYWAANGALVYRDPDGRDVVFARGCTAATPNPPTSETDDMIPLADLAGEVEQMANYAGQSVGLVRNTAPAAAIVAAITRQARSAIEGEPAQR